MPDFWGRGPGIEFGIFHNDSDALQDHCVKVDNLRAERETYTPEAKINLKKMVVTGGCQISPTSPVHRASSPCAGPTKEPAVKMSSDAWVCPNDRQLALRAK